MVSKRRAILACSASAILSVAATSWLLVVGLAPSAGGATIVSYDDLTNDVAAGNVRSIAIDDHTYRYYLANGPPKQATGPTPNLTSLRALCAAPANGIGPHVVLEP
jgi:hypothetical protein